MLVLEVSAPWSQRFQLEKKLSDPSIQTIHHNSFLAAHQNESIRSILKQITYIFLTLLKKNY